MRQPLYEVSMFRAMARNIFGHAEVWEFLQQYDPGLRILYLERESVLEQAISYEFNRLHRHGDLPTHPTHTFVSVKPEPRELDAARVLRLYQGIKADIARDKRCLAGSKILTLSLTYEEIVTMDVAQSSCICEFLGVRKELLHTDLKKVHTQPYEELVTNWSEIRKLCEEGG